MNIREGLKRLYIIAVVGIEAIWVIWPALTGDFRHPYSRRIEWDDLAFAFFSILISAVAIWFGGWFLIRWVRSGFLNSN